MGKKSKTKQKKSGKTDPMVKALVTELFQKCVSPTSNNAPTPKELFNAIKEISEMLGNIEKLIGNQGSVSRLPNREDCIEDFCKWAQVKNIVFQNIEIKPTGCNELGVFATGDFSKGELFVSIPRTAMMTSESFSDSQVKELVMSDPMLSSMPNVALALQLLCELYNEKSHWKPYISILPRRYSNILYFELDDIENLKGTSMFLEAVNVVRSIIRQYAYLSNLFYKHPLAKELGLVDKFTFADYKWAVATLMTRQNPVPPSNGSTSPVLALVPLLDMCNHKEGPVSVDYNAEAKQCECFVASQVKAGEELYIYYGPRPNAELVVYNGFFYEENIHDYIKMRFHLSKIDKKYEDKKALTKKLAIPELIPVACMPQPVKDSLAAFLQISHATEEEVTEMLKFESAELGSLLSSSSFNTESIIGMETKIKGLKSLKDRCSLGLRLIPETDSGDSQIEENKNGSSAKRLSILLRDNEKKLLQGAIRYVNSELEQILG